MHFPAVIVVGCYSFPLWRAQDDTSGMEWSGRIVILSSLSGLLDKSFVLKSKRKGKMFSVVKKTKQGSVCLGTGCISAAVSVGGAGRALIGSLGNRHWDLVGGRPAAGIAPLSVPPSPNPLRQTTARTDHRGEKPWGSCVCFVPFCCGTIKLCLSSHVFDAHTSI